MGSRAESGGWVVFRNGVCAEEEGAAAGTWGGTTVRTVVVMCATSCVGLGRQCAVSATDRVLSLGAKP